MPFIVSGLVLHSGGLVLAFRRKLKSVGLPQAPGHLGLKSDPVQKDYAHA